jgi:hypothetical protein
MSQKCHLAITSDCHATKKGHPICTACWEVANDDQREQLKELKCSFEWCNTFTCFEWSSNRGLCDTCLTGGNADLPNRERAESSGCKGENKRKPREPSTEPKRVRQSGPDSVKNEVAVRRSEPSNIVVQQLKATLRTLSPDEIAGLVTACVQELASRV